MPPTPRINCPEKQQQSIYSPIVGSRTSYQGQAYCKDTIRKCQPSARRKFPHPYCRILSQIKNKAHNKPAQLPIFGVLGYSFSVIAPFLVAALVDKRVLTGGFANLGMSMTGMTAFSIVSMQFVLMARIPWLEKSFGLNAIFSLHKTMAIVAALLACAHIGFLLWRNGNWSLVLNPRASWLIFFGRVSAATLIVILAFSFFRKHIPINNADWKWFHSVFAWTILVSGFVHSIAIGSSFETLPVKFVWTGYFAIAMMAWLYRNYWRSKLI